MSLYNPYIPLDIWYTILEYCSLIPETPPSPDDYDEHANNLIKTSYTILSCALTCRDVYSIVNPSYLYRTIHIDSSSRYHSILSNLRRHPECARQVTSLHISVGNIHEEKSTRQFLEFDSPNDPQWPYHLLPLQFAPFPFVNLGLLAIMGAPKHTKQSGLMFGCDVHPSFFLAWARYTSIRTLWLLDVTFRSCIDTTRIILSIRSLTDLYLIDFDAVDSATRFLDTSPIARRRRRRLKSLHVQLSLQHDGLSRYLKTSPFLNIMYWLSDTGMGRSLQTISIRGEFFAGFDRYASLSPTYFGPRLEALTVDQYGRTDETLVTPILNLRLCKNLRRLHLSAFTTETLIAILQSVSSKATLEELVIATPILWEDKSPDATEDTRMPIDGFHTFIDPILRSHPPFTHLSEPSPEDLLSPKYRGDKDRYRQRRFVASSTSTI